MKRFIVLSLSLFLAGAFISQTVKQQKPAPTSNPKTTCGETPELNKKIIAYVKANMGKKIGKGECWDVAAAALNKSGAKWDKKFGFGKEINYKKDCVFPGDIIQISDAMMHEEPSKGMHIYDKYGQHTAIILEVINKDEYTVADQNFGFNRRYLNTHPIDFKKMVQGSVKFYRPVK